MSHFLFFASSVMFGTASVSILKHDEPFMIGFLIMVGVNAFGAALHALIATKEIR